MTLKSANHTAQNCSLFNGQEKMALKVCAQIKSDSLFQLLSLCTVDSTYKKDPYSSVGNIIKDVECSIDFILE